MEIFIYTLEGQPLVVNLDDVGACYPDDDVIYFCGIPCRLSSATPNNACTGQAKTCACGDVIPADESRCLNYQREPACQ